MLRPLFHNRRLENWKGFKDTLEYPLSHEERVSLEVCQWDSFTTLTCERESETRPCLHILVSHKPTAKQAE